MLSPHTLTAKKQRGNFFTHSDIEFIVNGYTSGKISDDDMTSWLKVVFDHGMDHKETLNYTRTMLKSGAQLDFSHITGFVLDKHSTGGVGDKVSIVLAPLLAACGCYIPMLAGRGLGHTQGTIDKLETIPGYHPSLSLTEFKHIVENIGLSIIEQTHDICPADRKIYALRDVTNTIASFPLICGSIMSKKIAEGLDGLVLDIKVGNGAFMKTLDDAKKLGSILKCGVSNLNQDNTWMQSDKFKRERQRFPPTPEFLKHTLCRTAEITCRIGLFALIWSVCGGLVFGISMRATTPPLSALFPRLCQFSL